MADKNNGDDMELAQKPADGEEPAAGDEKPAAGTGAGEKKAAAAGDDDDLHGVGIFLDEGDQVDVDAVDLPPELEEPSFAQQRRNTISWVIFVLAIGSFVGGALYINSQEELKLEVELLFKGGLVRHKMAHILEKRERYAKEDTYAQNRYGEFKMIYSPRDAAVSVTQLKYKETIGEFMRRFVSGGVDKRVKVGETELKKFQKLTSELKKNTVVAEQNIKNLPITQRTNPQDPEACTGDPNDYCTYVYKVRIEKEKYRPREFVIYSEYSLEPPGLEVGEKAQELLFKNTGPSIYEVVWPGADLQPTPELFQEQFARLWIKRVKCGLTRPDYDAFELEDLSDRASARQAYDELRKLPEDQLYQKLADNGLLSYSGIGAKSWTLTEWKASVAELRQHPLLWNAAQEAVEKCDCDGSLDEVNACYETLSAEPAAEQPAQQ